MFFFSSRSRHTRSKRDWSSDVCSSDLAGLAHGHVAALDGGERRVNAGGRERVAGAVEAGDPLAVQLVAEDKVRSEERRVGKECCFGWGRRDEEETRCDVEGETRPENSD